MTKIEPQRRKNIRLRGYDYSSPGAYFLTICSYKHAPLFASIINQNITCNVTLQGQRACHTMSSCNLSGIGRIINAEIIGLPTRYPNTTINNYVIMPNHVHLLLSIDRIHNAPIIGQIVGTLKSITTKKANQQDNTPGRKIWQFRYHDRIIRDDHEFQFIWQYIANNIVTWETDTYYIQPNTLKQP